LIKCGNVEKIKCGNVDMSKDSSKFLSAKKPVLDSRLEEATQSVIDKNFKRLSLDLDADLHRKLKLLALNKGVSMRDLSIEALENFLASQ
jgi:hypothetical protein